MAGKPTLIFDGKCGFCRIWIEYWKLLTGDAIDYAPSQEVAQNYPQIAPEAFQRSVQLVLPDGEVFSGAEAVFRTLGLTEPVPENTWCSPDHGIGLSADRGASRCFLLGHCAAVRPHSAAAQVRCRRAALPKSAGGHLVHRFCIVCGSGDRADRIEWHPARLRVSRSCPAICARWRVVFRAHIVLVQLERRSDPGRMHRRDDLRAAGVLRRLLARAHFSAHLCSICRW